MSARKTRYVVLALVLVVAALTTFRTARAGSAASAGRSFEMYVACWHDEASEYHCGGGGDSTAVTSIYHDASYRPEAAPMPRFVHLPDANMQFPSSDVNIIVLTVYKKDGTVATKVFPRTVDAIFLSQNSALNMFHPYYAARARYYRAQGDSGRMPARLATDSARKYSARGDSLLRVIRVIWDSLPARAPK
jgi:hypothetical protein